MLKQVIISNLNQLDYLKFWKKTLLYIILMNYDAKFQLVLEYQNRYLNPRSAVMP
jgi:hypothetical protein